MHVWFYCQSVDVRPRQFDFFLNCESAIQVTPKITANFQHINVKLLQHINYETTAFNIEKSKIVALKCVF